jgi:O-antigen/teichoic acid export membrane protein
LRVVDWFRDRAVQRVVKFGLPVTIGKAVTSVTGLITLAILARHLGPTLFGVLALLRTVVMVTEQYANFNTWQAVIKYGTEAIADGRRDDVKRVIKLATIIDVTTAVIATLVIVALAFVIPGAFGWSTKLSLLCAFYAITVLTRVAGVADGIFRICDAYRVQAIASTLSALSSTIAIVIAVLLDASFAGCVIALAIGEVIGNVYLTVMAFWVARQNGYGGWARTSLRGARTTFPGILHFMITTNAQLTVRKTMGEADMFVVGAMLGAFASGLFRVIKQLGTLPARVFLPFEQVLFTELARYSAAGDYQAFRGLLRRSVGLATVGSIALWAVAAVGAEPIVRLVAGDAFIGAAPAFRWYLLAMVLGVANAPVLRSMILLGRPGTLFMLDLATLVILVGAVIAGAWAWGLVGVSLALLLHRIVHIVCATWLVARLIQQREATRAVPPAPALL